MTGSRRAERWAVGATVLLVHLAGLVLWRSPLPVPRESPSALGPAPMAIRLLPPAQPPSSPPMASPRPASRPLRAPGHAPVLAPRQADVRAIEEPPVAPAEVPHPAEAPTASATPLDLRLRTPRGIADRGALTEPPDSMRRAALNDPRSNVQGDPTQVLPHAVASATKGDCMKGQFAGGGMGLLSLPFLAIAAVRGDCRPQR